MTRRALLLCLPLLLLLHSCKKSSSGGDTPTPTPPPVTATIGSLTCASASLGASATAGQGYSGTISIPYIGGNGAAYGAGNAIASTGVTGLTATLQAGTLANGSGTFTYLVTGTPAASGTAFFSIGFGALNCSLALPVTDNEVFIQYGTPFGGVPERTDAIIYQVNMRAFSATSNFAGVTARLDSIKALGINTIYLMPIYPVGQVNSVNSPYAVQNYRAVNTEFGNLTDLRTLVDGAHSRNMSVLLDWVANHTAWDNPWITQHPDWYLHNSVGAIISPPGTGWNDVAQLDFTNAAMRQEMIRSMKYWVYAANVDGYRFDYADGPPATFWKQAVDSLRTISTHHLLLLAEGNRADHFSSGFDYTFGFNWYGGLRNVQAGSPATNLDALNTSEFNGATNGQQVVRYLTNHDVNGSDGTPTELFGGLPGSMAYFVATAYMKGVPMIYNGQEVGTPFRLTFPFTGADIDWSLNPAVKAEYKQVIAFRNASAAIRRGTLTSYSSANVVSFTRQQGAETVFVIDNIRNSAQTYTVPAALANTTWTNAFTGATVAVGTQVALPAYGYLVLKN
jgi:glycosidase